MIGFGAFFAGWRAMRKRQPHALPLMGLGLALIIIFRAPALPPVILGVVMHYVVIRRQRVAGTQAVVLGPVYLFVGLAALGLGMVIVSRVSPELALDRIGDTMNKQQAGWSMTEGGSTFADGAQADASLLGQLLRAPFGLINALFRPQLFDVRSPVMVISAAEMTAITWLIIRTVRLNGFAALVLRVQSSAFLLMCFVVTLVGCTFVGLATLNFGSLARYRVPFLPFYGALLAVLSEREERESTVAPTGRGLRGSLRRRPGRSRGPSAPVL